MYIVVQAVVNANEFYEPQNRNGNEALFLPVKPGTKPHSVRSSSMFFKSTMPSQNKPNRSSSVQLKQVSCKPLLPLVNGNMQPILTSLQTLHNFRHPQKGLGSMKRLPPPPIVKLLDIKGKLSERTIAKRPTLNFLIGKFPMA